MTLALRFGLAGESTDLTSTFLPFRNSARPISFFKNTQFSGSCEKKKMVTHWSYVEKHRANSIFQNAF
jgi:hypothetical protein